ncbi:rhamnan synthesis F family protein [Variovorax sp. Root411]|uniref:rhamnan synthesis F family protein n=1 Tax=Variovorax sp. Root411 TaxID=1736530 RepID=UPI000AEAD97F|nr:rhamnan synthesis F family protein [Variovorax sp. Root411]
MPKISILLTSFNHAQFIGEAIDSVLSQTFRDFELLILDDASTDESWWIIKSKSNTDPRIKAIRNSKKGEITSRVIDVISNVASGEYIAVHHSDDIWEPEKLSKQVAYLDTHPETGAVFTDAGAISEESLPIEGHFYSGIFSQPNRTRQEWLRHFFNHGNALCHPSALIRKQCFNECGYYRPWLWQIDDFDMWIRLLMKYEIHVLPEKLTRFRVRNNEANVSGNYRTARIRNFYEYHRMLDNYRSIENFEDLCKIFPEARKYYREDHTDILFALGLASLQVAIRPFAQLFSLNLIQEALIDPVRSKSIKAAYDFDIGNLMELTGRHDVFSLEELSELNKLAAERSRQIGEIQEKLSSDAEQLKNFNLGVAERDQLILDLDRKLSAHDGTIVQLTGEVQARDAEAGRRNDQIRELTQALLDRNAMLAEAGKNIAERDGRLVDGNMLIADLHVQMAEKDRQIGALDQQVETLDQQVCVLDQQVETLDQQVEALDLQVSALDGGVATRDHRIGMLAHQLGALHHQVAKQDEDAAELQRQLAQRGVEVDALRSSQSWRITRPLRFFGQLARRGKRVLAKRPAASPAMPPLPEPRPMATPDGTAIPAREHFDAAFYLESYPDVVEAGVDPYSHFVLSGAAEGRLGARPPAVADSTNREQTVLADTPASRAEAPALVVDPDFDEAFYLQRYPDVRNAGVPPYEHFVNHGRVEGRVATRPPPGIQQGTHAVDPATRSTLVVSHEASRTGAPILSLNMASASVSSADASALFVDPDFDEAYYLHRYPDIRDAGMPPYEHFINHGRAEGRVAARPQPRIQQGAHAVDPTRRSVLVVSHEASRTGAPILSLNIASELQKRYNVVVLLLGGGELVADFCGAATSVAGPEAVRGAPQDADFVIAALCAHTSFEFAIVNSIESRVVLRGLTKSSVPAVCLIHEFAAYTRPRDAFPFAMRWAGETVFSTRITYENAISELPALAHTHCHILPQGRCVPPAAEIDPARQAAERARVTKYLRPDELKEKNGFVIIGAGSVQYRKGVDLFMECAARVIRSPGGEVCRFVWIGNGYDPEKDIGYSSYLAEQLHRSGLETRFFFMTETPAIDDAYAMAGALLLSSRLDPLPNVAIDAMTHGLPVVCFANASGIADILEQNGLGEPCVAPYHDTAAMAELILKLARSPQARNDLGARLKRLADEQFDMAAYIHKLEQLASSAGDRLARELESSKIIAKSDLLKPDFFLRAPQDDRSLGDIVRHDYVRSWATGIDKRKLFPGFHPGIYLEKNEAGKNRLDPLAAYLQAGQPEGPWNFELIRSGDRAVATPGDLRTALHLHGYYPELLQEILKRLGTNRARPDLFISVPNEEGAQAARALARTYTGNVVQIRVVPNVGRDLGPFLTAFGEELVENYDIVGHIHTKKSLDIADAATGITWHRFLMENLLGGKAPMTDIITGRMAADPSIGLVFPDEPHIVDWGANKSHAEALAPRLGLGALPRHPVFPVGSMFWARTEAIRPLVDLKLDWADYPSEPLPHDGSMLHAIERLLPLVAEGRSTRVVLTHVDGVTR